MKIALVAMLFAASAFAQKPSSVATAACGPESVTFVTNLDDTQHTLAQPEPGKARMYFVQDDGPLGNNHHQHYTIKIGLDGAWVGAYRQNSYFTVSVEPGEHHVCANVQSNGPARAYLALAHFTAEPGKVYYFRTQFLSGGLTLYVYPYLKLDQPDSDQARYLIASYPLSVSSPRK
jgi:hypothetical protein